MYPQSTSQRQRIQHYNFLCYWEKFPGGVHIQQIFIHHLNPACESAKSAKKFTLLSVINLNGHHTKSKNNPQS